MYVPLPTGTRARYAQLTVFSGTGADVCVGEFRMFGADQAAAGMDFGADLSFTPQELAAGATFTYRGRAQSPVTIMRENGANFARIRLWLNPPPGYSDRRFRFDLKLFSSGGLAILDAIERQGYDTLTRRPALGKWRKARLMLGALR